ncbi:MAG TPA: DCC1-like thiol-disulfide oxidoreductase family protein [Gemmatimonadales bacterium]|nr:DCC1-like thiol-disulfide oxidoreductase family protein [Gemmatimonadales bacterium]
MPILFYDGRCGLCARSVHWVLAHERADRSLRFAPLQGRIAAAALAGEAALATPDSVVWHEPGADGDPPLTLVKSDAVLRVWLYVGGPWRLAAWLGRPIPRVLRDRIYDLVARHRHRLSPGPACLVPTPTQRPRFLEL